jgi:hypothetical protein
MSLFDLPRPTLNPAIFSKDEIMLPQVKSYLINLLGHIYPEDHIYRLTLLGSNVSHQYDSTSDIDVNVVGVKGQSYDFWHKTFKDFNNTPNLLPGTSHPINFFFQEYFPTQDAYAWRNSVGGYDIIMDRWIKRPKPFNEIGDPTDTYAEQIAYVKLMLKMVESEVHAIRVAIHQGDKAKALTSLKTLQQFMKKVDADRKTAYEYGGGTPSASENNLIYKLIEHGKFGDILKDLIGE